MRRLFGGMMHYGLLGAIRAVSVSSIELVPSSEIAPVEPESLPDQVQVGLPDEFRRGVEHALALGTLAPMKIVFAAHHLVDSAFVAFYDSTKVLSALLGIDWVSRTESDVVAVARDAITAQPFIE